MKILRAPAIVLMQQMRLLYKFTLVGVMFMVSLLLILGLLYVNLHKAVDTAERERVGVHYVVALEDMTRLVQQHRALHHLRSRDNAVLRAPAYRMGDAIKDKVAALDAIDNASAVLNLGDAWAGVRRAWEAVEQKDQAGDALDIHADYAAVVDQLARLIELVAHKSGLTLDRDSDSCHLTAMLITSFPQIAGRGAADNETALPATSEGILFKSNVLFARHAQDVHVNSDNQTPRNEFFEAGTRTNDAIYAAASASGGELDNLLAQRIELLGARIYMTMLVALGALAMTAYLVTRHHVPHFVSNCANWRGLPPTT